MLERVRDAPGEVLSLDEYWPDFELNRSRVTDRIDKLERRQYFEEPHDPGWRAFVSGDWQEALRLEELSRQEIIVHYTAYAEDGIVGRRVRVVEFPIGPYLQWELNGLRIRAECGENIHVVSAEIVAPYEKDGRPVPEMIILSAEVMYEIRYDQSSVLSGGRKIAETDIISGCRLEIDAIYQKGEDLLEFFEREVAPMPPPIVKR
ncbi:MAG: DUF6879 family protein [Pseudonocardiaceae bacterium]